jgi:RPC5 protein
LRDCAVLCRGNWCLLSKFCPDLPDRLKRLRTFVLLLLEEDGTIHRDRLLATYEQLQDALTPDQIKTVLTMVAKRVSGGWVPKIDDDDHFIIDHREVCKTHRAYWQRQQERFAEELRTYRQLT